MALEENVKDFGLTYFSLDPASRPLSPHTYPTP